MLSNIQIFPHYTFFPKQNERHSDQDSYEAKRSLEVAVDSTMVSSALTGADDHD